MGWLDGERAGSAKVGCRPPLVTADRARGQLGVGLDARPGGFSGLAAALFIWRNRIGSEGGGPRVEVTQQT